MRFDSLRYHRRSVRIKGYDYSQPGKYFITICTFNREPILGEVIDGKTRLSKFGLVVQDEWLKTSEMRPRIVNDAFVVMPNHLHGIITIQDIQKSDDLAVNSPILGAVESVINDIPNTEQFSKPTSDSIPTIVRLYKAVVTRRINELQGNENNAIWQSGYYLHIIMNNNEESAIRRYISSNPEYWLNDVDNPTNLRQ